jgi:LysM repeat protein
MVAGRSALVDAAWRSDMNILRTASRLAFLAGVVALLGGWPGGPAQAQSPCGASVTVAPGDTLGRIAARCGTTLSALLQANPQITNPNVVHVGQTIRMPGAVAAPPLAPVPPTYAPPPVAPPGAYGTYTVRPGDTLATIADLLAIPLAQLLSANPNVDPRFLRPGLTIRVPGDRRPIGRPDAPRLRVEPDTARPGSSVELSARGLPPDSRATILGGTDLGNLVTIERTSVDARGRLRTSVRLPDWARPGQPFYFAVRTWWPRAEAVADPIRIAWGAPRWGRPGGPAPGVAITGTLTREGVECPALRGDDGRLYTLAGDIERFRPGDRVRVEGRPAEVSFCMQGTTIEVRRIERAR